MSCRAMQVMPPFETISLQVSADDGALAWINDVAVYGYLNAGTINTPAPQRLVAGQLCTV